MAKAINLRTQSISPWLEQLLDRKMEVCNRRPRVPNNQALQVFYGTIPLILVLAALHFRKLTLLKDILAHLD